MDKTSTKFFAVLQALFVTFLWSTSFIIIKKGLNEIPPITFAGLRYLLAALILIPFVSRRKYRTEIKNINKKDWILLLMLGLVFYTLTQGIQFIGLSLTSTVIVSLMLNFTPLVVVLLGMVFLKEKPGIIQGLGVIIFITGIIFYFSPFENLKEEKTGIIVMAFGVLANAASSILGRKINSKKNISPLSVTFISMGTGSIILLVAGIIREGIYIPTLRNFVRLMWLAFINTAFAFTLWNLSLRTLKAMESSIINGTMLIQIAVLSILFLNMDIASEKVFTLIIVAVGAVLVQIKQKKGKRFGDNRY